METKTTWRWMTATEHYRRGEAIGRSDIINSGIFFRFYEDEYFIKDPAKVKTRPVRDYLVADIEDVKKAANG